MTGEQQTPPAPTRADFEKAVGDAVKAAMKDQAMDDGERKIRAIVRDEVGSSLGEFFTSVEDDGDGDPGDDGDGEGKNAPGAGEPKNVLEAFMGWLGSSADK